MKKKAKYSSKYNGFYLKYIMKLFIKYCIGALNFKDLFIKIQKKDINKQNMWGQQGYLSRRACVVTIWPGSEKSKNFCCQIWSPKIGWT